MDVGGRRNGDDATQKGGQGVVFRNDDGDLLATVDANGLQICVRRSRPMIGGVEMVNYATATRARKVITTYFRAMPQAVKARGS